MSILIKGIDMPKICDECPMRQINLAYCQLMHESTSHYLSGKEIQGRPNFCPLVEIPTPHGRLIDGDKIEAEAEQTLYGEISYEDIANAPTILEAEE